MSEQRVLDGADGKEPVTVASLVHDLKLLGLSQGMTVLVHASQSKLGWISGGPQAVVMALREVLGDAGTLMMPSHSTQLSEPSHWENPPVSADWIPILRESVPAFDADLTPTRCMGAIAELFRRLPGVERSAHPHGSFAAQGPAAVTLLADHALEDMWGQTSPLGHLYEHDGHVLLLGVDHGNNTSLHLAELRADIPHPRQIQGAPMIVDGQRRWVAYESFDLGSEDFAKLGDDFAQETDDERRGAVGWGLGRLMRQRAIVDFGQSWLERHRVR